MNGNKKTTMKDVAAYCGVSSMAVSKALNGKGGISRETAARIAEAARFLNYTPNLIAKSLRVNETRTLGVVISDSSHLLFGKMLRTIADAAESRDYGILIANTDQDREREIRAIRVLLNKRIDGLLLVAPLDPDSEGVAAARAFGVPVTVLMRRGDPANDSVMTDNFTSGYEMTEHLVKSGSRRIHVINLPPDSQAGGERLLGYRQALKDNGIEFDPGLVLNCGPQIREGKKNMRRLLESGLREGAVICGCDVIAIGAMKAVADAGFDIPGDFRVAGFDDIELLEHLRFPLTTIHQPVFEMAREGVDLLLERIRNPSRASTHIMLPGQLVVRAST